jgi:hypothetical protein
MIVDFIKKGSNIKKVESRAIPVTGAGGPQG